MFCGLELKVRSGGVQEPDYTLEGRDSQVFEQTLNPTWFALTLKGGVQAAGFRFESISWRTSAPSPGVL